MKISSRLTLAALTSLLMVVIICLALGYWMRSQKTAIARETAADIVMKHINELNILARGYMLHPEERPKTQFLLECEALERLLNETPFADEQQGQIVANIREDVELMKTYFLRLASTAALHGAEVDSPLFTEAQERLTGQILVRAGEAWSEALRLESLVEQERKTVNNRVNLLIFAIPTIMALLLTAALIRMKKRITTSLKALQKGTEVVAGAGFHHRIGMPAGDEIGECAQSFDRMTEQLRAITVSKNDLAREVEVRTLAEEQIRLQNLILDGMNEIFQEALSSETEEELGRRCLAVAERVTQSKFGFIGLLNERGLVDVAAISDPGWDACRMRDASGHRVPIGSFRVHGLYGRVVHDGKGFYTNQPGTHPDRIGLPEGHPPLTAFLGAPLQHMGQTIGMVAVGNRDGGYRDRDLEHLEALSVAMSHAIMHRRIEIQIRSVAQFPEENPNPVFRATEHGAILYANAPARDALAALGWTEGRPLPERLFNTARGVMEKGRVEETELTDSRGRVWSFVFSPRSAERHVNVYGRNITARKQAENALQQANAELETRVQERTAEVIKANRDLEAERQRFNDVLETLPVYVALLTPDYRMPFANRVFRELFGEPGERHCYEFLFNRTEPCKPCETFKVLKTDAPHRWEWTGPNGRNYDVFDFPFKDTDGSTLILEMGIDITERKRAQEELQESRDTLELRVRQRTEELSRSNAQLQSEIEERRRVGEALRQSQADLSRAQAVACTGSWRLDVRNNTLVWSDETHRIFGIPRGTIMTYETFLNSVHPDDRAVVDRAWAAALQGLPYDVEHRIVVGDQVKWVRERAELEFDADHNIVGGFGTAQDITERKQIEDSLKQLAVALARSNKDLEQFAYVASHDLQEPLRQISGFIELIDRKYGGLFDDTAREFFGFVRDGAVRMQALIGDLLAYSRVGRVDQSVSRISLDEVVKTAMQNLHARFQETAATIKIEPLPAVEANFTLLLQVFQNLIGNALKFRGENPPEIHIGARREGAHWVISVRDNGIGFPPDMADRIFMVFQRLHARDKYEGTGIGLAVCKRAIEHHGGRIWAESEPGRGATFHFTLSAR